jgi:hypothetical protein
MSAAVQTYGSKKEQIKQLLQANCSASEAAAAVGCEVSYVSQLMEDKEFSSDVVVHRIKLLQDQSARDLRYDGLEDKLLVSLEMKVESQGSLMKTETLLRALQTTNGAKRRGATSGAPQTIINNVVNLTLPSQAIRQFQVNQENEVISVAGQHLISMPAKQLLSLARVEKKEIENHETTDPTTGTLREISVERFNSSVISKDSF